LENVHVILVATISPLHRPSWTQDSTLGIMLFRYHGSQAVVYITNDPLYPHHQHHRCSPIPRDGGTTADAEVADAIVSHLLG